MATHISFAEVGKAFSTGNWGKKAQSVESLLKSLDGANLQTCLMLELINEVRRMISAVSVKTPPAIHDDPADGMLAALHGGHPIPADLSGLSRRAANVLRRGRFGFLREITKESLFGVRGCGYLTANEILSWAEQQKQGSQVSCTEAKP